jgi:putative transposase
MPAGLQRIYGRGHLHFITFSCYRRLPLLTTARARRVVVQELARLRAEMGFRLIGYVVMLEHVHLLISEPPAQTPSAVMHRLKLRVSHKLRAKRRRACEKQLHLTFPEQLGNPRNF